MISAPAGTAVVPDTTKGFVSDPRTASSTLLVSDAIDVLSLTLSTVPTGTVTSWNLGASGAGGLSAASGFSAARASAAGCAETDGASVADAGAAPGAALFSAGGVARVAASPPRPAG